MKIIGTVQESLLLLEFYNSHLSADSKTKREIIKQASATFGISETSVYARFKKLNSGKNLDEVTGQSTTKRKKNTVEQEKIISEVKIINAVQFSESNGGKFQPMSTEIAIDRAFRDGRISKKYPVSTVNRYYNTLGISRKYYVAKGQTSMWEFDFVNQMQMVDATPAQWHYLREGGEISPRLDINPTDKKLEEILEREGLKKIIIIAIIDGYSRAWYAKAFAANPISANSRVGSENSVMYAEFFRNAWLNKNDLAFPFEGVPEFLYSDSHSSFKTLTPFFENLDIHFKPHFPGNPAAKGMIERKIRHIQQSIESQLNKRQVPTLVEFNELLYLWCRKLNQNSGTFEKFISGSNLHPIKSVTLKNLQDANVGYFDRVVDQYGCVSIQKKLWFVSQDVLVGSKVQVHYRQNEKKRFIAKTKEGLIYELDPKGPPKNSPGSFAKFHYDEDGNKIHVDFKESKFKKAQKEVSELMPGIRNTTTIESIKPDDSNLVYFPPASKKSESHSIIAKEKYTDLNEAMDFISKETKSDFVDVSIVSHIQNHVELLIKTNGSVSSSEVYQFINIIKNHIEKMEVLNG